MADKNKVGTFFSHHSSTKFRLRDQRANWQTVTSSKQT